MAETMELFEETVHPAEVGFVTLAELRTMIRGIAQFRRHLNAVTQDLKRVLEYNKQPIYLLDFSELHAYLWPSDSQPGSQYKSVLNFLFKQSRLRFVLPPGAVEELVRKLERDASRHTERKASLEQLLSSPIVREFLKLRGADGGFLLGQDLSRGVLNEISALRGTNEGLNKLAALYETGRLTHLSTLIDVHQAVTDDEVLTDALFQLTAYRLGTEEAVNFIDAHNYALTHGLNNLFYESKDLFFLLVTSSPRPYAIFEDIKWKTDPLYSEDTDSLNRVSLVRHPIQLLFHSYMLEPGRLLETKADLDVVVEAMRNVQAAWSSIPQFKEYAYKKRGAGSATVSLPDTSLYRESMERFTSFYRQIYRPVTELLATDSTTEFNRRLLLGVSTESITDVPTLAFADTPVADQSVEGRLPATGIPETYMDYRELLGLYDRVINLTVTQTDLQISAHQDFPERSVGDFQAWRHRGYESLVVRPQENSIYNCVEIDALRVYDSEEMTYFSADVYSSFYSFFWETSITLPEFVKLARRFVASATRWKLVNGVTITPTKEKLYNGLYFYLTDEIKHFKLHRDIDLTNEYIGSIVEPHWKVRFVRIGLPFADLCYDFQAIDGLPQRAGVMSHMPCRDAIADFIHWTNSRYTPRRFVVAAVDDTLSRQPGVN